MSPWQVLGIEPTKDKKEIKKAYAKLAKMYHPEENPEEFKQIQEAYQACLHAEFETVQEDKIEEEDIQKVDPIHVDKIQEDSTVVPPKIPRKDTLFSEEKDVSVYQNLLQEINKGLPKKIGEKEVCKVFSDVNIMPFLEDESFCTMLENLLLKHEFKYIKKQDSPVFRYLSKYRMDQLRHAMDYTNIPFYQKPIFYIYVTIFVVCVITFFSL